METIQVVLLIYAGAGMLIPTGVIPLLVNNYFLNGIKSKTVGDGQYDMARFVSGAEIKRASARVPYEPVLWRQGKHLPRVQGIVVGGLSSRTRVTALVDSGDTHLLMIGAAGVGKTANFLYPCIKYACASGMSWLCTDTKGDLFRSYTGIAQKCYGYQTSILDLRNPTCPDGDNILGMVNKYMDLCLENPENLAVKAKAEKYIKITTKAIISSGDGDASSYGQNMFFYDAAEGLLASVILPISEYCPKEQRHIVGVFKLIRDLLVPSLVKGKNQFQLLMQKLPAGHKAKWFAGAVPNTTEQVMASVFSTATSRLNAFLDSGMEQTLRFDSMMDTKTFCNSKSAIFIVPPEKDSTKYFMVSLFLQQIYRETLSIADEHGGKLSNRVVTSGGETGIIPKIESLEMLFSAGRSRWISVVPIIQSFVWLQKNYGKDGSEIIVDNRQGVLFGGFASNLESAEILSKALGNKMVLSDSISRGKSDSSQSLQMIGRPFMTPDELESLPKGHFILVKTGCHPMRVELCLFFKWGIEFEEEYEVEQHVVRPVSYVEYLKVEQETIRRQFDGDGEASFGESSGIEGTSGGDPAHIQMPNRSAVPETRQPLRTNQGEGRYVGYYDSVYSEGSPRHAISVYMYLKERADKKSQCYSAMSTIVEELNLSRRTIQRAVADLEKAGFIKMEQRFQRKGRKGSLLYTVSRRQDYVKGVLCLLGVL